jgi:hypothetical protein
MTKQAERELVLIALQVGALRDSLAPSDADGDLAAGMDEIAVRLRNVARVDDVPVSLAADYLGVSAPTVRSWVKRGVLEPAPNSKPLRVGAASLQRVRHSLDELRARGQDGDWLASLTDYLDDIADRRSAPVQQGLKELERGKLEPA